MTLWSNTTQPIVAGSVSSCKPNMFPGNRSVVVDPQRLPESECVISKSSPPVEDFPNLETDSQILDRAFDDADLDGAESTHSSVPGGSKKRQKRNSNAEAANEMELRRAFAENKSRPLADIGESLRVDQLGSSAEKTRQIFAMCWLNSACKQDRHDEAVPRGRVYSRYVDKCNNERIKILNPASFGKLVRIVFANIKTRRLGVRGQSKYNYCGLSLVEDKVNQRAVKPSAMTDGNFSGFAIPIHCNVDSSFNVSANQAATSQNHVPNSLRSGSWRPDHVLRPQPQPQPTMNQRLETDCNGQTPNEFLTSFFWRPHQLHFSGSQGCMLTGTPEADPFPDLRLYLPPNTDLDVADVLNSLYRSHCTSLVENLRHIKLRSFWNVFSSFNGTMTVPVQKLFSDPMISPWIESCDQVMYREMARMLSKLTNLAVPPLVLQSLTQISQELCNHIRNTFGSYPLPLVSARTRPAATFQAFVRRLVKVNEATHAVGKLISNLAERRLMHSDWTTQVDIPAIIQGELPGCAPQQVYNLLSMTVPNLLHPLLPDADHEQICDPPLDRWIALIDSIPSQFGHVDAWVLISIVGRVTSAALRDITSRGGNSFNAWWVVKMWIDEKLRFMAEEGGLLDLSGYLTTSSVDSSLLSGDDADVSGLPASQVRFNPTVRSGLVGTQKKVSHDIFNSHTGHQTSSAGFDDSGIGMQSSEEEPDRSDDSVRAKHGFTSESERISTLG